MQKKMSYLDFSRNIMASFFILMNISNIALAEGPAPSVMKEMKPLIPLPNNSNIDLPPLANPDSLIVDEFQTTDKNGIENFLDKNHENRKNQIDKFLKNDYEKKVWPNYIVHREVTEENSHIPPVYYFSYYVKLAYQAISENNLNKLRNLVDGYKLQSIQDNDGDSLLIRAAMLKRIEIARMLIMKKSNINIVNKQNKTPLHYAIQNEDYNMVKLLLSMGANPNIKDIKGKTAIAYAKASHNMLVKQLVTSYTLQDSRSTHSLNSSL